MKITLLTYGSRGDVQPFVALAVGLQKAGHNVTLALPGALANLAQQHGVNPLALPGDPAALSQALNRSSHNLVRQIHAIQSHVLPLALQVGQIAQDSILQCDLVVHSFLFTSGAHTFARPAGIPDISAQLFPIFAPTGSFSAIGFARLILPSSLQRAYNRFTHRTGEALFAGLQSASYAFVRQQKPGWPKRLLWPFDDTPDHPPAPLLLGLSPQVLPESPGWARRGVHVTGYWYLADPTYQPPAALSAFLAGGAAPVCIGFGSMLHPRAAAIQRSFLSALRDAGQRAIILTGWDGWQAARAAFRDPAFYYLESAPHDWLLPRCKLAIHHGGAGTTAAALQAGVPQWILPFTADQPFWAERIHHIGAAAAPLKPNQVRPETVAARLHAALQDPNLRARAAQLGAAIRAEDGVSRAVEIITQHGAALKR